MPYIQYEGKKYDFAAIKQEVVVDHPAFIFCHHWLNGQKRFMLQTSGSTGKPKPIEVFRWQMEASAKGTADALQLQHSDKALICINTTYIGGMMMLARTLILQMDALLIPADRSPLLRVSDDFQPTFIALVPLQLSNSLQEAYARELLDKCKAIIVGGAPVSRKLEKELQGIKAPVYSTYGMTETVSHIALRHLNGPEPSKKYQLIKGVEIGQDERGCLKVAGEVTRGKWLQTNDLVSIAANGKAFQWLGRADQVINSGGVKISITAVESMVEAWQQEEGVSWTVVALGIPDSLLGEKAVLAIVEEKPQAVSEHKAKALMHYLHQNLPQYHAPKAYYWIDEIPQTPSQKTDRKALMERLVQQ